VARLLLLCSDTPYAAGWVAHQARHLEADVAIKAVSCHRLLAASARYPRCYDWLIEIEPASDAPGPIVDRGRCADLLGDLRLSGARPIALLVA
jgi:hypothetical protein